MSPESSYAIDDLHQMATAEAEHENDSAAISKLNRAYEEARQAYLMALNTVRADRAAKADEREHD